MTVLFFNLMLTAIFKPLKTQIVLSFELTNYSSNFKKGIFIPFMSASNRKEILQMNRETNTKNVTWIIYFLIVVSEK